MNNNNTSIPSMVNNIHPFDFKITSEQRKAAMMQEPCLVWLTGLSGSGKTTLAIHLDHYYFSKGFKTYILDGDNVRTGLNKDLGFNAEDRKENIRRIGEVAKLMLDAGLIVFCAFISPYQEDRQAIRNILGEHQFFEVYVNCPVEECEKRDVKGLYAKARMGIIPNFTGISAPYEPPNQADAVVLTATETVADSLGKIIAKLDSIIISQSSCIGSDA